MLYMLYCHMDSARVDQDIMPSTLDFIFFMRIPMKDE